MKPEQINEIITKVRNENNGMVIHTKLVEATGQALISHLETEGELVELEILNAICSVCETPCGDGVDEPCEKVQRTSKVITSKLSPHLARVKELEGENERLKGSFERVKEQAIAIERDYWKAHENQAVQAERDRIKAILYDIYDRKEIDIIFNTKEDEALQK